MNRIIQFSIFFAIFFFVYFSMHLYVFKRLSQFFKIDRNIWFYLVVSAFALSFPVFSMAERFLDGSICKFFYTAACIWVGVIFFMLWTLLVYELVKLFVKFKPQTVGVVVCTIVFIIVVYSLINAMFINVKIMNMPMQGLTKEIDVVQLSDIHVGTINNRGYLQRIVNKVNEINPDIVLITGDLVDGSGVITNETIAPLNDLNAKTFFVRGNHETYEGVDLIIGLLNKTGVVTLRNEIVNFKGLQIVGIDFQGERFDGNNDIIGKMKIDKDKPTVLMYHSPTGVEEANKAGVDLQLSGHTHRGQIMPFNIFTHFAFKYVYGLYDYNGTKIYVSPGSGTWGPPMRFGSRSEITLIRLTSE